MALSVDFRHSMAETGWVLKSPGISLRLIEDTNVQSVGWPKCLCCFFKKVEVLLKLKHGSVILRSCTLGTPLSQSGSQQPQKAIFKFLVPGAYLTGFGGFSKSGSNRR